MQSYFIRDWVSNQTIYTLKGCDLFSIPEADDLADSISGFVKYFLYGRSIIIVDHSESSFIVLKSKKIKLSEIVNIEFKQYFIFSRILITTNDATYTFIDLSVGDFFARKFDPTYDYLDQELVFGFWFLVSGAM
ncbi:MAG: hypothetical protein V3U88_07330 [Methylococcales bacterium]